MNVVTHLLIGWTLAEHTAKSPRDRALITVASVVPDLDGLGLIVDAAAPLFDWTIQWYERFHHLLLHGIPGALVCTALMAYAFALAVRRGYSPVGLFSARGDAAFVETLRRRWRSLRGEAN